MLSFIQTDLKGSNLIIHKRDSSTPNTHIRGKVAYNSALFGVNSFICSNSRTKLTSSCRVKSHSTSRILYDRNIRSRVQKIAPFLRYDGDPYIIIHNGRLVWIIDAYTITHRYPYSVSMEEFVSERRRQLANTQRNAEPWGNYIRNSVKVIVDAYDGSVDFYVMEREQGSDCGVLS